MAVRTLRRSDGPGNLSAVDDVFDYAVRNATPDVGATLQWLIEQGAAMTRQQGGERESFGNVLLEFTLDDAVLTITRDRGQWMLDVQCGELRRFDFDVIHAAFHGIDPWAMHDGFAVLPKQLPDGVSWLAEIPSALAWLRSTADVEDRLTLLQRRRGETLFGPLPGQ